jgi:hypothetical protein
MTLVVDPFELFSAGVLSAVALAGLIILFTGTGPKL